MLPHEGGDYVVVTKALKDVMCLYEFGIPAIAPCSENLFLTEAQYNKLKSKFKRVYLLYDLDHAGIAASKKIKKEFPDIQVLLCPRELGYKDFSDLRKGMGYAKTLELVNKAKEYYGETW